MALDKLTKEKREKVDGDIRSQDEVLDELIDKINELIDEVDKKADK